MKFKIPVSLNADEYRELTEVSLKRGRRRVLPILVSLLLIAAFLPPVPTVASLCAIAAAVLALAWYLGSPVWAAARGWRAHAADTALAPIVYQFGEEELTVEQSGGTATYRYSGITQLVETETLLLLYMKRGGIIALPKESFTIGTADDFRPFMIEKTRHSWQRVSTARYRSRRTIAAITAAAVAFVLVLGVNGLGYIRRSVTFVDSGNTCTVDLPYFLQETPVDGGNALYTGNGITVSVDFSTTEQLQRRYDVADYKEPLTLKTYAAYEQAHGGAHPEGEWIEDNDTATEWYMQYASGADYVCTVLRWTEEGCWKLTFRCPGERQDTYYNRFTTWRRSAVYTG